MDSCLTNLEMSTVMKIYHKGQGLIRNLKEWLWSALS